MLGISLDKKHIFPGHGPPENFPMSVKNSIYGIWLIMNLFIIIIITIIYV